MPRAAQFASILAAALLGAVPATAHHSLAAEFDIDQPVTLEGVVASIEWMNPHAWLHVDVTTETGEVEHWQIEFGAPVELIRRGWHRQDLQPGDRVSIEGFLAKYKAFTARASSIVLPGGKQVFSGTALPEGTP